jgi:hypothetical protein
MDTSKEPQDWRLWLKPVGNLNGGTIVAGNTKMAWALHWSKRRFVWQLDIGKSENVSGSAWNLLDREIARRAEMQWIAWPVPKTNNSDFISREILHLIADGKVKEHEE